MLQWLLFMWKKYHFFAVVKRAQPLWVSAAMAQMALIMHESSLNVEMEKRCVRECLPVGVSVRVCACIHHA